MLRKLHSCQRLPSAFDSPLDSGSVLDCLGGALGNACSAVNTFGIVDNGDISDGNGSLRAYVDASATSDTVVSNNLRHLIHLGLKIRNVVFRD